MWQRLLVLNKLKASGIHLGLSSIAFGVVLYFILVHWYPQPWFPIDGGWQGVRIMAFVDLVLGPTLTLIIFDPSKSRRALLFDFSMIGLAQVGAFTWGAYAVHTQRPVAMVFWEGSFYSVAEKPLRAQGRSASELSAFDDRVPALIYGEAPKDPAAIIEMVQRSVTRNLAEYEQFEIYKPLREHLPEIFAGSDTLQSAIKTSPGAESALQRLLAGRADVPRESVRFVSFTGRYERATLVFDGAGFLLGTLPPVAPEEPEKSRKDLHPTAG